MNMQQLFQCMAERISASTSVKNVYGDPVVVGNRTVIRLLRSGTALAAQENGGVGGGGVSARPSWR
jgi:hypothetical protein